jgi:glutathione peroxidase
MHLINRRHLLAGLGSSLAFPAHAEEPAMSLVSAYTFSFPAINGGTIRLSDFRGKPVLVVNTASQCGLTGQFTGLQRLWTRFNPLGLAIIGVPSNDFGGQEPGDAEEIMATAEGEYHIEFPMAAKTRVTGPDAHPFYRWTASLRPRETPRWNFHKYLIDRNGQLAEVFPTSTDPTDSRIISALIKVTGAA